MMIGYHAQGIIVKVVRKRIVVIYLVLPVIRLPPHHLIVVAVPLVTVKEVMLDVVMEQKQTERFRALTERPARLLLVFITA